MSAKIISPWFRSSALLLASLLVLLGCGFRGPLYLPEEPPAAAEAEAELQNEVDEAADDAEEGEKLESDEGDQDLTIAAIDHFGP